MLLESARSQQLLKQKRVEEAQRKLRSEIQRINRIASDLESAYLDLKQIHNEFNPDLKSLSDALPGTYQWQLEQLVHFNNLNVPVLEEKNGTFVLGCRLIDLFKPEKDAKRRSQAERAKQNKLATDAVILASQQRKTAEKHQHERERIEEILSVKKIELNEVEARRARDMEQVARGVRLNLSGLDAFIASTNVEIEQLQKDLDAVEKIL